MQRRPLTPLVAAACAGAAAWCSMGALGAGASGAARLGLLPPGWLLPTLAAAAVVLAWTTRLTSRTARPLFFSGALILPWLPGPTLPALLVWTGPVTIVVWLAVLVGVVAARGLSVHGTLLADPRRAPGLAAAVACALYIASAWWLSGLLPGGDEPHYLVITQSLLRDHDLQIENNHSRGDYLEYFHGQLKPDYLRRGSNGQIYSIHAPGLPALVAPAYAAFGYPGVVLFLSIVAGAATGLLWHASYLLTGSVAAAWFGWASGALTAPFFFQAFEVFPDGVAAALVLLGAMPLLEQRLPEGRFRWWLTGAALALLPWLHTRFATIACALGLCLLLRVAGSPERWRSALLLLSVPIVGAAAWFSYFRAIYGTFSPSAPYGHYSQSAPVNILRGLPALLLDQQFGAIANAPVYGVCLVGFVALARRHRRLAIELAFTAASYLLVAAAYHMWWAGRSAPARFAVPVLLLLVLPGAWLWQDARRMTTRAVALASLVLSVFMTAMLVGPRGNSLAFNDRDGFSLGLEWLNALVDLPRGVPSFFRQTPGGALARAALWMLPLAGAWLALRTVEHRSRAASARAALALATPVCLGLAAMLALAAVWRLDRVAGVTPASSRLDLLRHYDGRLRPLGIDFATAAVAPADALLPRLRVSMSSRRPLPPDLPLLVASEIPAGRYRLSIPGTRTASGSITLSIGRTPLPLHTWDLRRGLPDGAADFDLPVNGGSLLIVGDAEAKRTVDDIELQPLQILSGRDRAASGSARQAARYGRTRAYFLDDRAFVEPTGFWVAGGASASIVADPDARRQGLRLFLRNAPVENRLTIEVEGRQEAIEVKPREERIVDVAVSGGRRAVLVRLGTERGFTPALGEPGSSDFRFLGCWIEIRDEP
jgi:hypothetical protein